MLRGQVFWSVEQVINFLVCGLLTVLTERRSRTYPIQVLVPSATKRFGRLSWLNTLERENAHVRLNTMVHLSLIKRRRSSQGSRSWVLRYRLVKLQLATSR